MIKFRLRFRTRNSHRSHNSQISIFYMQGNVKKYLHNVLHVSQLKVFFLTKLPTDDTLKICYRSREKRLSCFFTRTKAGRWRGVRFTFALTNRESSGKHNWAPWKLTNPHYRKFFHHFLVPYCTLRMWNNLSLFLSQKQLTIGLLINHEICDTEWIITIFFPSLLGKDCCITFRVGKYTQFYTCSTSDKASEC